MLTKGAKYSEHCAACAMVGNPIAFDEHGAIKCPCGHEYTQHHSLDCFNRDSEDSDTGMRCSVGHSMAAVSHGSQMNLCPSARRSGLVIAFFCEAGCEFSVSVIQHKGCTYMEYESYEHREVAEDDKP